MFDPQNNPTDEVGKEQSRVPRGAVKLVSAGDRIAVLEEVIILLLDLTVLTSDSDKRAVISARALLSQSRDGGRHR